MTRQQFAPTDIGDMYDEHSRIAAAFRDGQSHIAYWYDDEDPVPLSEAAHRLTTRVTDTLGLRGGETVLDAGCGPGETSVYLATRWGARVTGVSISAFEVEDGRRRAAAEGVSEGVSDLARFQHGDYSRLPFADGTFDAVLAMEWLLFAPDLPQVLGELYRVLRPGGKLAISDISLESTAEPERVERFAAAVKLNVLMPLPKWLVTLGTPDSWSRSSPSAGRGRSAATRRRSRR